jgi:predicted RND superfamily exporter protein
MTHAPHQSESPVFRRFAAVLLRHRALFTVLVIALTGYMAHATATRLMIDNSVELFMPDDDPSFRALEDLRDAFGRDQFFLVLVEGDVFSRPYLERLGALRESVQAFAPEVASLGERRSDRDARRGTAREAAPKKTAPDAFGDFEGDDGAGWGDEAGGTVVDEIISVLDVRRTWMDGDTLRVDSWLDPIPADDAELARRAQAMLAEPTLVGQVLGQDGQASLVAVRTQFMSEEDSDRVHFALRDVVMAHDAPGFHVRLGGGPSIDAAVNIMMLRDMLTLVSYSSIAMLAVLFFLFRRFVAVVAPIVVVTLSVIWTAGLMSLTGMPLGMLSSMLPAFLFVVGIGDSVHILAVHATRRRAGVEPTQAIIDSVAATGLPVLFTTLTTMVGLASFHFAAVVAIRQLGYAGAFGVAAALLNTLIVMPLALSLFPGKAPAAEAAPVDPAAPRRDIITRALVFCFGLSEPRPGAPTARRNATLAVSAALCVLSLFGVANLRVAHDPLEWFDPDVEVRVATERIDATVGGMATANVLIEATEPGTLRDLEVLRALAAFERHVLDYREPGTGAAVVKNATSLLDAVRETHRALHGGAPADWRLPDTQRGASDLMLLFENAGPAELSRLMNADATLAGMTFRAAWREASAYGPLIAHIDAGIARYIAPLGDRVTARTTGGVYTFYSVVTTLVSDLARSFGVALVVITILMAFFLRNLRLGLVAMVPNLLPILFVIAFMGATGVPIDLNSLLIASIAIGIAVDDTIHLLHHFEAHHDRGEGVEASLLAARRDAGRAVVATSLLLMLGFFIFAGAEIEPVRRFGVLVGLTVVMALLTDLITLPALLRLLYRERSPAAEAPAPH